MTDLDTWLLRGKHPPPARRARPNLVPPAPLSVDDVDRSPRRLAAPHWFSLLVIILLQLVAGVAMAKIPELALMQALAICVAAAYSMLRRDLILMLAVVAYLVGSEVLWRQVRPPIPYTLAPYLVIGLSVFGAVVVIGRLGRGSRLAGLYLLLMFPSIVVTITTAGSNSREFIVFALSGPAALATLIAVTSQVRMEPWVHRRLLWTLLIGILAPLMVAITRLQEYLAQNGSLDFTESSQATSGGFGPVQVSSVLGLGVVIAVLLVISEPDRMARLLAFGCGVAFAVQSFLTFSRGGMTAVGISVAALVVVISRDRKNRVRLYATVATALLLGYFVLFPRLNSATDNAFDQRFSDTNTTRTELAANDVDIFKRHPLFGVGPGMTKFDRLGYETCQLRTDRCSNESSSHTEFTRMLSEHGIPGLASLLLLFTLTLRALRRRSLRDQAFGTTLVVWAVAQLFYANLRVVAVPVVFAFAFLSVVTTYAHLPPEDAGATEPRTLSLRRAARGGHRTRAAVPTGSTGLG